MEQTTLLALQPTHLFYMKLYSSNIDREYSVSFYIRVRHGTDGHPHEEYCATVVMYREMDTTAEENQRVCIRYVPCRYIDTRPGGNMGTFHSQVYSL